METGITPADGNFNWDEESLILPGFDKSRGKHYQEVLEVIHSTIEKSFIQSFAFEDIGSALSTLHDDGVVKFNSIFDENLVKILCDASQKSVEAAALLVSGDGLNSTAIDCHLTTGYTAITQHSPGRYDMSPFYSNTQLFPAGFSLPLQQIEAVVGLLIESASWSLSSTGILPLQPASKNGVWHRDTRALFAWRDADGCIDKADAFDCQRTGDFYVTVLVCLSDVPDDKCGATEFILGSHRLGATEAGATGRRATTAGSRAGDAFIFNGKILHRGLQNSSANTRHCMYMVYSAGWYNDG